MKKYLIKNMNDETLEIKDLRNKKVSFPPRQRTWIDKDVSNGKTLILIEEKEEEEKVEKKKTKNNYKGGMI